ncbi:rCG50504 [Rattus norvegicus]|uniref:RCG50504 n=1 Tax=Rattus norvegicus TaxID=10116 RepID=A6KCZ3_RAT|nr:rCG50504 [Rattus norvegicus]
MAVFHLLPASTSDLDSFWPVQFPSISGSLAPHSLCFSASVSSLKPPVPFSLSHSLSSSSPHPSIRVRGLKERLEVVVTSA